MNFFDFDTKTRRLLLSQDVWIYIVLFVSTDSPDDPRVVVLDENLGQEAKS